MLSKVTWGVTVLCFTGVVVLLKSRSRRSRPALASSVDESIHRLYGGGPLPANSISENSRLSIASSLSAATGCTPLIALPSLSVTGCQILAKAEHLNPGYSIKDRAAKFMLDDAERRGELTRGNGVVIEATSGNTGIGLALLCAARSYRCILCMPSTISPEKIAMMRALGAEIHLAPAVAYEHEDHYHKAASKLAQQTPNCIFTNQFENISNARAHFETTGPEIWQQTDGKVDGLCVSAGTGGTVAGLSLFFKSRNPACRVALIDPPGSSLYAWLTRGQMLPTAGTSITEGIGITRLTANFTLAKIDEAFVGVDQEAIDMAYYLLKHEGLWVGPSAALNVVGAVKLARQLGPGHQIVTVLCDSGDKYKNTLYNAHWLEQGFTMSTPDSTLSWIS